MRLASLPALTGLLLSAAVGLAQEPFRAGVDMVHLPVVVLDEDGQPITGLEAADFDVRENGEGQTVVSFGPPGQRGDLPLHLGLMLDKSGSMEEQLDDAASAAVSFVDLLAEVRDVTYVEFDETVGLGRYQPSNYLRLFERIRDRRTGERTLLYDAMAHYLDTTVGRPGQHIMVVYTDGGDAGSWLTADDVGELLRWGNVVLYVVGYLEDQSQQARFRHRAVLTRLARETGGRAFFPTGPEQIDAIYDLIRREIEGRYTLGYIPSAAAAAGEFRRVDVQLHPRPSDIRDVEVRTRTGYIAFGAE